MATLRLRSLGLRARTGVGMFGADVPFDDGLVVLRAENTSGKSTCVQGIVYALGLEGMLGPSYEVPLPHVMTHSLEENGVERPVLESWVTLEIENGSGARLRVTRAAKHDRRDLRLIRVSTIDSHGAESDMRDHFVRVRGAATNEAGFHERLARFIGWELPDVTRYDGSTCPLYMETVFPLLFVEQKHGWSGIQARMPLHYRIREVGRRAVEFLLDLDAYKNSVRRVEVEQELRLAKSDWSSAVASFRQKAQRLGALFSGVPDAPVEPWPEAIHPELLVSRDGKWISLGSEMAALIDQLNALEAAPTPSVALAAPTVDVELIKNQEQIFDLEMTLASVTQQIQTEQAQIRSVDQRLAALRDDLAKNKDVVLLQKLGGIAELEYSKGVCPTCHQAVSGVLQPMEPDQSPMAVIENIEYIESQIALFETMRDATSESVQAKTARALSLRNELTAVRASIRAQKATLVASTAAPSEASIEQKIRTRERIASLKRLEEELNETLDGLIGLSTRWKRLQAEFAKLRESYLSKSDEQKLQELQTSFGHQVAAYGLSSVPVTSLTVSRETYRPSHEGFDLGFDLSASDMIRTIWAYLLGLVEVARAAATNHLGLLILDEPRQQETARSSYRAFLRRASAAGANRQQVIVATSEEVDSLREMLTGVPHALHIFQGKKILQRLAE
jgi:hypothetical protein